MKVHGQVFILFYVLIYIYLRCSLNINVGVFREGLYISAAISNNVLNPESDMVYSIRFKVIFELPTELLNETMVNIVLIT